MRASVRDRRAALDQLGEWTGLVTDGANLFSLPRIKVGNWDGSNFEETLAGWLPPLY